MERWFAFVLALCVGLLGPGEGLKGQSLQGVVLDSGTGSSVPRALIRLVDHGEKDRSVAVADSLGRYSLSVPSTGEYRLLATGLGYHTFTSPLLLINDDRPYLVDIELDPAPVGIPGLVVSAQRFEELARGVQAEIGVSPQSLRNDLIFRPDIDEHIARAHNVTDLVRWSHFPSIVTEERPEGPCFKWRNRHCLPVFLNGVPVLPEWVSTVPLDMLETIAVLGPGESVAYIQGAILLYTAAWIR